MSTQNLETWLKALRLPLNAKLDQVDTQYFKLTEELSEEKKTQPEVARQKQEKIDSTYYELLKHFIFEKPSRRAVTLSVDDVVKHRDIAPPRYRQVSKDELQDIARQPHRIHRSIEQMIDQAGIALAEDEVEFFELTYAEGNLLEKAPNKAVIVHATNCQGVWGAGIALVLRTQYPEAHRIYQDFCSPEVCKSAANLVGSCLLIHPQYEDYSRGTGRAPRPRHYIACLFTSIGYGQPNGSNPGKDSEEDILMNTDGALEDLRDQLEFHDQEEFRTGDAPENICSNKFNSGLFDVPWHMTEELIIRAFYGFPTKWTVFNLNKRGENQVENMRKNDLAGTEEK